MNFNSINAFFRVRTVNTSYLNKETEQKEPNKTGEITQNKTIRQTGFINTFTQVDDILGPQPNIILPEPRVKFVPNFPFIIFAPPPPPAPPAPPAPPVLDPAVIQQRNNILVSLEEMGRQKADLSNFDILNNNSMPEFVSKLDAINTKENAFLADLLKTYPENGPEYKALKGEMTLKELTDKQLKIKLEIIKINSARSQLYNTQTDLSPESQEMQQIKMRQEALSQILDKLKAEYNKCESEIKIQQGEYSNNIKLCLPEDRNLIDGLRNDRLAFSNKMNNNIEEQINYRKTSLINEIEKISDSYKNIFVEMLEPGSPQAAQIMNRLETLNQIKKSLVHQLRNLFELDSPQDKVVFSAERLVDIKNSQFKIKHTMNISLNAINLLSAQLANIPQNSAEYESAIMRMGALQATLNQLTDQYNKNQVETIELERTINLNLRQSPKEDRILLTKMLASNYDSVNYLQRNNLNQLKENRDRLKEQLSSTSLTDRAKFILEEQLKSLNTIIRTENNDFRRNYFRVLIWNSINSIYDRQRGNNLPGRINPENIRF